MSGMYVCMVRGCFTDVYILVHVLVHHAAQVNISEYGKKMVLYVGGPVIQANSKRCAAVVPWWRWVR